MKDKELKFTLNSIKQLSSYLNSMESLEITELDDNKIGFGKAFKLDFNNDTGIFRLSVIIDFLYGDFPNDSDPLKLFGISTVHVFELQNYNDIVKVNNEGKIDIPPPLFRNLVSIAYATARGLLFGVSQKTEYDGLILPLTDPHEFDSYFQAEKGKE